MEARLQERRARAGAGGPPDGAGSGGWGGPLGAWRGWGWAPAAASSDDRATMGGAARGEGATGEAHGVQSDPTIRCAAAAWGGTHTLHIYNARILFDRCSWSPMQLDRSESLSARIARRVRPRSRAHALTRSTSPLKAHRPNPTLPLAHSSCLPVAEPSSRLLNAPPAPP